MMVSFYYQMSDGVCTSNSTVMVDALGLHGGNKTDSSLSDVSGNCNAELLRVVSTHIYTQHTVL